MRKRLLLVGPLPPPVHGAAVATEAVFKSDLIGRYFSTSAVNTNRPRLIPDTQIGKLSFGKVMRDTGNLAHIISALARTRPDIVYLCLSHTATGLLRDCLLLNVLRLIKGGPKSVVHLHGGSFDRTLLATPWLFLPWIRKNLRSISRIIVLTPSLTQPFQALGLEDAVRVVPYFVENDLHLTSQEFERKICRIREAHPRRIAVLFLSNLLRSKGYWDVLECARLISNTVEGIEFHFAGAWVSHHDKNEALRFVSQHNLRNVVFHGFVSGEKKRLLLERADVFVLPSRHSYEGLPISMLEAMAMGAVIFATPQGGIPDVVQHRVNGYIVDPEHLDSMVENLKEIYGDGDLHMNMARRNAEAAARLFRKEGFEESILQVLVEIS